MKLKWALIFNRSRSKSLNTEAQQYRTVQEIPQNLAECSKNGMRRIICQYEKKSRIFS